MSAPPSVDPSLELAMCAEGSSTWYRYLLPRDPDSMARSLQKAVAVSDRSGWEGGGWGVGGGVGVGWEEGPRQRQCGEPPTLPPRRPTPVVVSLVMLLLASLRGSGAASRSSGLLGLMRPRLALPARRPQRWRGMSTAPAYTLTPDDLASFHRDVRARPAAGQKNNKRS